jgi:hypothetical protein
MATRRKATNETVITPKPPRVGSPNKASVGRILLAFLLIGATSFGGVVVAYVRSSLVGKHRSADDRTFHSCSRSVRACRASTRRIRRSSRETACIRNCAIGIATSRTPIPRKLASQQGQRHRLLARWPARMAQSPNPYGGGLQSSRQLGTDRCANGSANVHARPPMPQLLKAWQIAHPAPE